MVKKSTYISQEDFPNNEIWTRCKYPNENPEHPVYVFIFYSFGYVIYFNRH